MLKVQVTSAFQVSLNAGDLTPFHTDFALLFRSHVGRVTALEDQDEPFTELIKARDDGHQNMENPERKRAPPDVPSGSATSCC